MRSFLVSSLLLSSCACPHAHLDYEAQPAVPVGIWHGWIVDPEALNKVWGWSRTAEPWECVEVDVLCVDCSKIVGRAELDR